MRLVALLMLAFSGSGLAQVPGPAADSRTALVFLIAGQSNAGGVAAFSFESNEKAGLAKKHPTIPGSTAREVGIPTGKPAYPRSYIWTCGFEPPTPGRNLKGANGENFKAWAWTDNNGHLSSKAYLELATRLAGTIGVPTLRTQCPAVFGDHGVFQQGIPLPVRGITLPQARVSVQFGEQCQGTTADDAGHWRVELDSMVADKLQSVFSAPAGRTLTIRTERDGSMVRRAFKEILVGEVWLCSGQSNMAGKVRHNHVNQDPNDNLLLSDLPAIRHSNDPDGWRSAVPGSVGEFTRVGF